MSDCDKGGLALLDAESMEKFARGLGDIQEIVSATRYIENMVKRGAFFGPLDRAPVSVLEGVDPSNVDLSGATAAPFYTQVAGGQVVSLNAKYTVPANRCAFICPAATMITTTALAAGQVAVLFAKITRASGRVVFAHFTASGPTSLGQYSLLWLDEQDTVEMFAQLSNGAGVIKAVGWLYGIEYNKGGN